MKAIAIVTLGVAAVFSAVAAPVDLARSDKGVFAMTNDAHRNEVVVYRRTGSRLVEISRYATGGRGSGGTIDPLTSQGSLVLAAGGTHLIAVNAGSGTVSVFGVQGTRLWLQDVEPTYGVEPAAVSEHGDLVYVANSAAASNVVAFHLRPSGRLDYITGSLRFLSGTSVGTGAIAISPNGAWLAVAERTTNNIDLFPINADGTLGTVKINLDPSPGAFAIVFSFDGALLVSETGTSQPNSSTVSSFFIEPDGALAPVSLGVPTMGAAACWQVITPDGKFLYVSNAGTSNISAFSVAAGGVLQPLTKVIAASNPSGSTNLDIAISTDGKYLYTLNGGSGTISTFAIGANGLLTQGGMVSGLAAKGGINGIAAN